MKMEELKAYKIHMGAADCAVDHDAFRAGVDQHDASVGASADHDVYVSGSQAHDITRSPVFEGSCRLIAAPAPAGICPCHLLRKHNIPAMTALSIECVVHHPSDESRTVQSVIGLIAGRAVIITGSLLFKEFLPLRRHANLACLHPVPAAAPDIYGPANRLQCGLQQLLQRRLADRISF